MGFVSRGTEFIMAEKRGSKLQVWWQKQKQKQKPTGHTAHSQA